VPAYLLMTFVLKVTGTISWPYLAVCLLYLCNTPRLLHASAEYGPYWSLSVEEQFYLTWPFVVRRLSTLNLIRLSIAIVLLSPFLRYGLQFLGPGWNDIRYKTWDVADFFAAGTLLAISVRSRRIRPHLPHLCRILLITGSILVLSTEWVLPMAGGPWLQLVAAFELSPYVVLFAGVVLLGFLFPGLARSWPGSLAVFLGEISYGLYLFHQFLFNRVDRWLPADSSRSIPVFGQICLRFVLEAAASIAIAYLSRRYFEEIFLRMKPKRRESLRQKEFAL
jgi:peptidoglycan/LPS O-acetylase OafA/YrhL